MELTNDFDVPADIDTTWAALTDLELIAPCMPGAELTEVEGDIYRGTVKVKVGPITAKFKGEASFVEQDADAHRAVLKAAGRDTGGKGNANATITAQLTPAGDGTHVSLVTDLAISGKVAQFGRSAMADISTKLIGQFVDCLETSVLGSGSGADEDAEAGADRADTQLTASTDDQAPTGAARPVPAREVEAIDLLDTAGANVTKVAVPAGMAILILVLWLLRRRRS